MSSHEKMFNETVLAVHELVPSIDIEVVRSKLSEVFSNYKVKQVDKNDYAPGFKDKIMSFLNAKKVEGKSRTTLKGYMLELRMFMRFINNDKSIHEITQADIRNYLASNNDWKLSTIGRKLTTLRSFFSWLVTENILRYDPTVKINPPRPDDEMPKTITIEELEMLREACKTRRQRALLEVLYSTGCRLSEIKDANVDDVNFQNNSFIVKGKGRKEREVYLSFKASYHLKLYLYERKGCDDGSLFCRERRPWTRLCDRSLGREIDKIAENVLEKKISPHTLRRTFATLTLNNGAELTAVQELLGHTSPNTTLRYARITEERKKEQHRKYLIQ